MSDTVYAIASGKGGVGKTTTAINLGAMLADRGHSVVVVDTDLGMANLAGFLDFAVESPTLHEVLAEEADYDEAIYEAPGGIDVLPSATDIEAFAKSNPANLSRVVEPLRAAYDYVLLDTGAGVSYDTLVPLALADATLLVATPDVASVRDTAKTGELSARVGTEVVGAVLTQRSSNILSADDVESTLGTEVLAVVPSDEAVPMGVDAGRPLASFAPNAPAGQAYRELAAVLTGDAEPDPELELDDESEDADDGDDDRITPETLTEGVDREADAPLAGAEVAENVRTAVDGDEDQQGLLGGELAKAADEIRREAARDSAAADDGPADDADGSDRVADEPVSGVDEPVFDVDDRAPTDREEGAGEGSEAAGADGEPDVTDASDADATDPHDGPEAALTDDVDDEARSVDDLLEQHLDEDRLGEESPPSEQSASQQDDDPLDATETVETDPFGDASDADDPLGAGDPTTDQAPDAGANSEADAADPFAETADVDPLTESEASSGRGSAPSEAGPGEPTPGANRSDESASDALDAESDAVPFTRDRPEADQSAAESADADGRPASEKRDAEADDSEDSDGEESDGVLDRLGSLFR